MLKLILSGALGNDAEVKDVGGSKVINFSVAVSMDYKDKDGKRVEKTEWVKAVMWRDQSSKIADYLKKGKKVLIEGVPESEGYQSKDGEVRSALTVKVKEVEFLN
ncbi:single-stranded DNA-binding protein [Natronoflexus pectinivorans]|uniref:Single-stranded DNA-binding protein n=1 Tax=Natronoflexus pectinivorans TaxID=682526 RepID=A0A4R2GBJ8_9BACT|nr:single-stranded DNA-binding protein [Natronoflexus pectinivorans]TCO05377.1 single-strand DNA-binding protein [Natronoflexus pectinivorans]